MKRNTIKLSQVSASLLRMRSRPYLRLGSPNFPSTSLRRETSSRSILFLSAILSLPLGGRPRPDYGADAGPGQADYTVVDPVSSSVEHVLLLGQGHEVSKIGEIDDRT